MNHCTCSADGRQGCVTPTGFCAFVELDLFFFVLCVFSRQVILGIHLLLFAFLGTSKAHLLDIREWVVDDEGKERKKTRGSNLPSHLCQGGFGRHTISIFLSAESFHLSQCVHHLFTRRV